ncbi:hypothetical protein [Bacterioplanoides sp.]|uniref:hypothetical protein n=1 Tax=Bacterioplanoides sp. TaxID=2066072 RepID=UPI003AFF9E61
MRLFFIVVLMPLMASCSIVPSGNRYEDLHGVVDVNATVEYVGPNNVLLDSKKYPEDAVLLFPSVPGGIFGKPNSSILFAEEIDSSMKFTLDLLEKREEMENSIRPLDSLWKGLGMEINPADTLIGRVGTFPYSKVTGEPLGGGGFIDPEERNSLILIYVNKACKINGDIKLNDKIYSHDLQFSGPGFYWVELEESERKRYSIKRYKEGGEVFSIHVRDLMLL